MKFKSVTTALLAVTLLSTAAYTAHAADMEGGMDMKKSDGCMGMMDGMMGGMSGGLHGGMSKHIKSQLTPEQNTQFDDALKAFSKKIEPAQQALFVKNQELKALHNATSPDVKAVSKTASEIVHLQSTLKNEREAFEEKIQKDFNLKDLHGGMMHGKQGNQTDAAAGHEAHKH